MDRRASLAMTRSGSQAQSDTGATPSVSLILFAMTRSDDEGLALWRCKGWRILVRHEGLEEGVCR